jgi:hypothetical protein
VINLKIEEVPFISGIQHYFIPHISLRAHQVTRRTKPLFLVDNEEVKVEELARRFFETNGYTVFKGDDVHLYFSVLSYNFKDSFFYDVYHNWVGENAYAILTTLEALVLDCVSQSRVNRELIVHASHAIAAYYSSYDEKKVTYSLLTDSLEQLDQEDVLAVIKFYRSAGYTTKGSPDLFIAKDNRFAFVEVKSLNDSLSPYQYDFIEGYLANVGDNIYVCRVLPTVEADEA